MGIDGQRHGPYTLPPGNSHGAYCRGSIWTGMEKTKSLTPAEIRGLTVQLVTNHYPDYNIDPLENVE